MAFSNDFTDGMSYALSELGIMGNPQLAVVDGFRVRGGAIAVDSLDDRNSIPIDLRKADVSKCYVRATQLTYVLRGGVTNDKWTPDSGSNAVTLEVGSFLGDVVMQVGVPAVISFPANLFLTVNGRSWSVVSVRGLSGGLVYDSTASEHGAVSGTPTVAGNFVYVVNGQDSEGHKAQYVIPISVLPAAAIVPTTVGSAALNIVMGDSNAECSIVLTTAGFAETGAECFAVNSALRRFISGTDVDNCLACGSAGYSTQPGGIGFFSFAWGINLFRSRYPLATTAAFDVYVHPSAVDPDYVTRVNYSYYLSNGLQKVSLQNAIDYGYKDSQGSVGGFWHYNPGTAVGQQNTVTDLHQQFTITGLQKKKIGTMVLNLVTGVSLFTPINAVQAPTLGTAWGDQSVTQAGNQTLAVPATLFNSTVALTLTARLQSGAVLPAGITFGQVNGVYSYQVDGTVVNGSYLLQTVATDTYNQATPYNNTLVVNRNVNNPTTNTNAPSQTNSNESPGDIYTSQSGADN